MDSVLKVLNFLYDIVEAPYLIFDTAGLALLSSMGAILIFNPPTIYGSPDVETAFYVQNPQEISASREFHKGCCSCK